MDEVSQGSFYEDERSVAEAISFLKPDEGSITFKSTNQQVEEGTPYTSAEKYVNDECDFTVPVCEESNFQPAELRSWEGKDQNLTSVQPQFPSAERPQTGQTRMANDYPSRSTGDLMHLGENLIELSSECLILSSPPSKRLCLQRSIKDVTENNDGGTKRYLYFDWKPHGRFESEFANKGPVVWPAIGVKSELTRIISQKSQKLTVSFFAMVEKAKLLSEEKLREIKKLAGIKDSERGYMSAYKGNRETSALRAEKVAAVDLHPQEENTCESELEFYTEQETNSPIYTEGLHFYADQEVPFQHLSNDGNSKASENDAVFSAQFHRNSDKPISNEVQQLDVPAVDGINRISQFEESAALPYNSTIGSVCSHQLCLEFAEKAEKGKADSCGESPGDFSPMGLDFEQEQKIMMVTNEHVASNCPILPPEITKETDLCSFLRTIDERDLIDESRLGDVVGCPLQQRNRYSLTREATALFRREEIQDSVNNDTFGDDIEEQFLGLECLITTGLPNRTKPASYFERFDKEIADQCAENQTQEDILASKQAFSFLRKTTPSSISRADYNAKHHYHNVSGNGNHQGAKDIAVGVEKLKECEFLTQENSKQALLYQKDITKALTETVTPVDVLLEASDEDKKNKGGFLQESGDQGFQASDAENETKTINCLLRGQIGKEMPELDGPEMLQFAMMFVQGALKKSQTVHETNNPLESKLTYQSQHLVLNRSEDDKLANVTLAGSYLSHTRGEYANADKTEPTRIRPSSHTSCNRPFRLGLPRKHGNKSLHPYIIKKPNSER